MGNGSSGSVEGHGRLTFLYPGQRLITGFLNAAKLTVLSGAKAEIVQKNAQKLNLSAYLSDYIL